MGIVWPKALQGKFPLCPCLVPIPRWISTPLVTIRGAWLEKATASPERTIPCCLQKAFGVHLTSVAEGLIASSFKFPGGNELHMKRLEFYLLLEKWREFMLWYGDVFTSSYALKSAQSRHTLMSSGQGNSKDPGGCWNHSLTSPPHWKPAVFSPGCNQH